MSIEIHIGRAWRYVRFGEDAAAGIGINRVAVKLYAYMTGAVIARRGLRGTFYAAKMTCSSRPKASRSTSRCSFSSA